MMKISSKNFLIFLLVFTSLIPNIGIKISTLGFNWTLYRTSILLSILVYLQMPKRRGQLADRSIYRRWIILVTAWLAYGAILLIISPYRNPHRGFVELLSIFNGSICMYILLSIVKNSRDLDQIVSIVFYVYIALVFIGIMEILTGVHLPMSYFNDSTILHLSGRTAATGVFYSENDFSAFLTCLAPILMYKKKNVILSIAALIGVIYINSVNDANICRIAMTLGVGYYFIFIKQYIKRGRLIIRGIMLVLTFAMVAYIWVHIDSLAKNSTLLYVIRTQQLNAGRSKGSLYARLFIYIDSLRASANTSFLGIGPAAFTNYFILHPSASGLVNPHNLYLEILVEYGIIIAAAFTVGLFRIMHRLRKRITMTTDRTVRRKLIVGCETILLYCIVCIAPSSFIGYAWQWIVITIGIIISGAPGKIGYKHEKRKE